MGDYASKGVAGSGLGLGIAGTALGLLNGNGLNLFGNNQTSALQSEIAQLKSERYTDNNSIELYKQTRIDNAQLRDELGTAIKALIAESANNRTEVAVLKEHAKMAEQLTDSKISQVAMQANNGITCLNNSLTSLANTVANITKCVVPITAVCPQPMPLHNAWVAPTTTTTQGA